MDAPTRADCPDCGADAEPMIDHQDRQYFHCPECGLSWYPPESEDEP